MGLVRGVVFVIWLGCDNSSRDQHHAEGAVSEVGFAMEVGSARWVVACRPPPGPKCGSATSPLGHVRSVDPLDAVVDLPPGRPVRPAAWRWSRLVTSPDAPLSARPPICPPA